MVTIKDLARYKKMAKFTLFRNGEMIGQYNDKKSFNDTVLPLLSKPEQEDFRVIIRGAPLTYYVNSRGKLFVDDTLDIPLSYWPRWVAFF